MNGSGTPVHGTLPVTTATFSKACPQTQATAPAAAIRANGLFADRATLIPLSASRLKSSRMKNGPKMPVSSATVANTKSVWGAGMKYFACP
jgi:hypothetical protein